MKRRLIAAIASVALLATPAIIATATETPQARGGYGDWPV